MCLSRVTCPAQKLFVAAVDAQWLSGPGQVASRRSARNPLVGIEAVGKTVEGRTLEVVRIGDPKAPYRVFLRARAYVGRRSALGRAGLLNRLLKDDDAAKKFRARYYVWVMPMANKDGVARGMTRFNVRGMDLNRNWDKPADGFAPENTPWRRGWNADFGRSQAHLAVGTPPA